MSHTPARPWYTSHSNAVAKDRSAAGVSPSGTCTRMAVRARPKAVAMTRASPTARTSTVNLAVGGFPPASDRSAMSARKGPKSGVVAAAFLASERAAAVPAPAGPSSSSAPGSQAGNSAVATVSRASSTFVIIDVGDVVATGR